MSKNHEYLKDWDDYQNDRPIKKGETSPILLPIAIGMTDKATFTRRRMKAGEVKRFYKDHRDDIPAYMFKSKIFHNPNEVFKDYCDYFGPIDGVEGPVPETVFDICVKRPVWLLYTLEPKSWKFTKGIQYSTENDPDDLSRNFEKICTMDRMKALLLSNRCRSKPKGLKFNLHVTISQKSDGRMMRTPIIIDPGSNNDDGTSPTSGN